MNVSGRPLGRYRLLEPLGSGGMSVVYKGIDAALEREVAVKVLHPHLAVDPSARERFAREARAVARLQHPNILEVFDVSEPAAAEAYLVTEYIRGETLKVFLNRVPLRVPEAAALVVQAVAAALAHAHAAQVVHRDVKPENVMVREDGVVKLMDFGIAKVFDRDDRMTQTGTLVGSPAHMAPEIIAGENAGFSADVFSVGTLLYAALTGELPFQAPNTPALLQRILEGRYLDPRERAPATSDALAAVVARCLERNPQTRYPDGGALFAALTDLLLDSGVTQPEEERAALFADPVGYQELLRTRLIAQRLQRAEEQVAARQNARALSELNLLLALAPDHPRAKELLGSLRLRERRRRRGRRFLSVAAGLVFLVTIAFVARRWPLPMPTSPAIALRSAPSATPPRGRLELVPGDPVLLPTPPTQALSPHREGPPFEPSPAPSPIEVAVLIRPYGSLRVDGAEGASEALARHTLHLLPGLHQITVSCVWCDEVTEPIEVKAGEENVFRLRAQLKPAQVAFRYQPTSARVRVGSDEQAASESLVHPFRVESPRGPPTFRHRVEYEVSAQGFKTAHRTVYVEPGKLTFVEGTLERS